jgi:hypothetical protein
MEDPKNRSRIEPDRGPEKPEIRVAGSIGPQVATWSWTKTCHGTSYATATGSLAVTVCFFVAKKHDFPLKCLTDRETVVSFEIFVKTREGIER